MWAASCCDKILDENSLVGMKRLSRSTVLATGPDDQFGPQNTQGKCGELTPTSSPLSYNTPENLKNSLRENVFSFTIPGYSPFQESQGVGI